ncbi:MAG: hypothetical protein C0399_06640 [Syntrophus sp. (in: bacteria)]|nr:hypothetical protein [Syntrophus sp. (in: bacteria)]
MAETFTKPFKGILYNKENTDNISSIVCPPYDVISDNEVYYKKSDVNAIRLELPRALPTMDQYAAAKQTMDDWLKKGILLPDKENTVYVYEQEFEIENISFFRRGFIALHKLSQERILTHEETRKKAKADREQLISTLKTYTSLIFGLYEDKDEKIEDILAGSPKEKIYDFTDEQSVHNRFYRMTDTAAIAKLVSIMDTKNIYIADGHHRLGVSYKLNVPYIPIYLTNMYSPGIVILPYHRIINFEKPRPLSEIMGLLKDYTDIVQIPYAGKDSVKEALSRINEGAKTAFVLYPKDDPQHLYIVKENKPFPAYNDQNIHESLKRLKVNIIHSGIIKNLLKIEDEEISFTQDHYESVDSVRNGSYDLAFFLPPTSVEEVKDIADNSLYMPPKSTFFYPKILTGLVFYQYA